MSATTYTPRPGSLPYRVIEFFQRNPDEELTDADIAQKFGGAANNVMLKLRDAQWAHYLTRVQVGRRSVWRRGSCVPPAGHTPSGVDKPMLFGKAAGTRAPLDQPRPRAIPAARRAAAQAPAPEDQRLRVYLRPTGELLLERAGVQLVLTKAEQADVVSNARRAG